MSKLSIITVNLNNAAGLRKTIESVINQTFTDYEYIIIDGGSTDGSVEIIKEFADKFSYWVSEPDKGIYNAMNRGLCQSCGELVTFLNSGDEYLSNISLEISFNCIKEKFHSAKLFFFDYIYQTDKQCVIVSSNDVTNKYKIFRKGFGHPSTFYKREILAINGGFDENFKISADRDFYMRAIVKEKIAFSYFPFALSVFKEGGFSTDTIHKDIIEQEDKKIVDFYYSAFEKKVINSRVFRKLLSINYASNFLLSLLRWKLKRI